MPNKNNPFISDKTFRKLEKNLIAAIETHQRMYIDIMHKGQSTKKDDALLSYMLDKSINVSPELCHAVFLKMLSLTYTDNLERPSSVMPLYNGNFTIGTFGSVFADIDLKDHGQFRIHLLSKENGLPETCETKYLFYIENMTDIFV